ncbi:unnamed protein product, partial [Ilex paraguariensis]
SPHSYSSVVLLFECSYAFFLNPRALADFVLSYAKKRRTAAAHQQGRLVRRRMHEILLGRDSGRPRVPAQHERDPPRPQAGEHTAGRELHIMITDFGSAKMFKPPVDRSRARNGAAASTAATTTTTRMSRVAAKNSFVAPPSTCRRSC